MITTAVIFFLILSVLILVHEFGHFITAKFFGVYVEEFGLGLPPKAFGKKIRNTIYSINWLPIGGFVKLAGEDEEETASVNPHIRKNQYFWAKTKKQKAIILTAGVLMNFLLACIITSYFLIIGTKLPSDHVTVEGVMVNTPAQASGIKVGDRIMTISKFDQISKKFITYEIKKTSDLITRVSESKGTSISVKILRGNDVKIISVIPRVDYPKDQGAMGIAITDLEFTKYPFYMAPFAAVKINIERAGLMLWGIWITLSALFAGKVSQLDVAGPIGIAQITGQAIKFGFQSVLEFTSILSLNLAVLNILPFPALDGGRLFFVFAEKLLGKKIKSIYERRTHQIGMLILLFLVLLVSINDIARILRGG